MQRNVVRDFGSVRKSLHILTQSVQCEKKSAPKLVTRQPPVAGGSYSQQQQLRLKILRMRKGSTGKDETTPKSRALMAPGWARRLPDAPPAPAEKMGERANLRDLLNEVYQVIRHKKEEKLSVDTIVVVNAANSQIVQQNMNTGKKTPICIDLRQGQQQPYYIKESKVHAQSTDTLPADDNANHR